jgi:hypothetical protein
MLAEIAGETHKRPQAWGQLVSHLPANFSLDVIKTRALPAQVMPSDVCLITV